MKNHFFKSIFIGLLILGFAGCAAQKPNWRESVKNKGASFTYHFKKGDKFKYRFTTNTNTSQEVAGQTREINSTIKAVVRYNVQNIQKDGVFSIQSSIDSLDINFNNPMMNQAKAMLQKAVNKPVTFTITKIGKIGTIDGLKAFPSFQGAANWEQTFSALFFKLPNKPIKIGDSWTDTKTKTTKSGPMNLKIVSKSKYTLKSIQPYNGVDCLFIIYTSDITLSGKGNQSGMALSYTGTGSSSGKIYFNPETSTYILMTSDSAVDGTVSIPSRNMEIPSSTTVSTKAVQIK